MVEVEIRCNEELKMKTLSGILTQYITDKTPLKRVDNFYEEIGLDSDEASIYHLPFWSNALIDPKRSGLDKQSLIKTFANLLYLLYPGPKGMVKFSKMDRVYITKACRAYCTKDDDLCIEVFGEEYMGMVKESAEKFCKENNINKITLSLNAYLDKKEGRKAIKEYPGLD